MSYNPLQNEFIITGGTVDSSSGAPEPFCVLRIPRESSRKGVACGTTFERSMGSKNRHSNMTDSTCIPEIHQAPSHFDRRLSHAQCLFGRTLVIFGGWNGRQVLNDVLLGNVTRRGGVEWKNLPQQESTPSTPHQAIGQFDTSNHSNDVETTHSVVSPIVRLIRFVSRTRYTQQHQQQLNATPPTHSPTSIPWPSPRSNMAYGSFPESQRMIIYGGLGSNVDSMFADLWVFSLRNLSWHRVTFPFSTESIKRSRSSTMMTDEDNNRIFLFGGCHREYHTCSNNLYEVVFSNHEMATATVTRRFPLHSESAQPEKRLFSVGFYMKKRNSLILIGGRDIQKDRKFNDCWEFDLSENRYVKQVGAQWDALLPLSGHASCMIPEENVIVVQGGNGVFRRHNQFLSWSMEVSASGVCGEGFSDVIVVTKELEDDDSMEIDI